MAQGRSRLAERWRARPKRERALLGLGCVALVVLALWVGVIRPAWRTLEQAPAQAARLDAQLQHMKTLAAEATQWRGSTALSEAQAREAAQAATARLGVGARLQWQGDRAVLQVERVAAPALWAWLGEVRSGARLHAEQVQLRREGEALSGTVTVLGVRAP